MAVIKPKSISGFYEYPPNVQLHAQRILDQVRSIFELYGFGPIETPIVERLEVLLSKSGDTDKEMYVLDRYMSEGEKEAEFGLKYDLTVPFARYVAGHFSELTFPFKRYQIQDCWRGERPQEGRYRQFRQCDVDIVSLDSLPLIFDVEIPLVVNEVLLCLGVEDFDFRISNRNVLDGYLLGLGIDDSIEVRRSLDKLDKVGADNVKDMFKSLGLSEEVSEQVLAIGNIKTRDMSFKDRVIELGVENEVLTKGLDDLSYVASGCFGSNSDSFCVDLSVTRGFDYYTGTVFEVTWNRFPELGSVAGGGRYEDLAGNYINKSVPGVGMSVGFTRIFGKLVKENILPQEVTGVTKVLIARTKSDGGIQAFDIARELRSRGIATEIYWAEDKLKKQIQYANKKRIPFVVFDEELEVKDLGSGEQTKFDPSTWAP